MMFSESFFRISALLGFLIIILVLLFGYLFFEPYLTEETVTAKVLNKSQYWNNSIFSLII